MVATRLAPHRVKHRRRVEPAWMNPPHFISVDEFERMVEADVFAPKARIELIEGVIRTMPAINEDHAWVVDLLTEIFITRLRHSAMVRVQGPIRLARSEPQPDLVVYRRGTDRHHPRPEQIVLAVEVADTSSRFDQRTKRPIYANATIREYWIVDVKGQRILVYTRPVNGRYEHERILKRGETAISTEIPALRVEVDELFGDALPLSE